MSSEEIHSSAPCSSHGPARTPTFERMFPDVDWPRYYAACDAEYPDGGKYGVTQQNGPDQRGRGEEL